MRLKFALLLAMALLILGCVQIETEGNSEPLFKYTRVPVSPAIKNLTNSSVSAGNSSAGGVDNADSISNGFSGYSNSRSWDAGSSGSGSDTDLKWQYDLSEGAKTEKQEEENKQTPMDEAQSISFEVVSPTTTPNSEIWNASETDFLDSQNYSESYSGPYVEYKGVENDDIWGIEYVDSGTYYTSSDEYSDFGDAEETAEGDGNQTEDIFNGTDDDGIQGYEYANLKGYSWD